MNIEELKRMAELNAGWSNASSAWNDMINEGGAVVGHIDEDGNKYDVAVVDLVQYDGFEGDSLQLAKFYAAANPAAVLELIAEVESLRAEVKTEQALSFRDQVAGLEKQRDKLLAASKKMIEWFGSSSLGDAPITAMRRAIANAERQP